MRIGGDGGWGAITGNTYQIKTMAVTPASASGMRASEIEALFSRLDPAAVAEAGRAHLAAARTLEATADSLITHARALAGGWSGTAAQASVTAFRQLHETAVEFAQGVRADRSGADLAGRDDLALLQELESAEQRNQGHH